MSGEIKKDGGPAFPGQPWPGKAGVYEKSPGMTLRDWLAGQAMSGIMSDPRCTQDQSEAFAEWAYAFADAMLAEREKRGAS